MSLRLAQDSKKVSDGWWNWSVWLEGNDAELDAISHVTYYLHPTFPQPVREKRDRSKRFILESAGWGAFTIRAVAHPREGNEVHLEHHLELKGSGAEPSHGVLSLMISNSMIDEPFAQELRKRLNRKLNVVDPKEAAVSPGISLDAMIRDSDALLAVISPHSSRWVGREIETAMKNGVPVIPVVIEPAEVPDAFRDMQVIQVKNSADASKAVSGVVKALRGKFGAGDFFL